LGLRGFISIILNPFLRVFAISAFLKVIHAPKTPKRGGISGTPKITFLHLFFQILAIGTSHKVYKLVLPNQPDQPAPDPIFDPEGQPDPPLFATLRD
jgi:hypothetical protein